uniref:Chitin synthase n=1 Tax=Anolis carolinensis TaxID=28377 RepID=H9GGM1_ANOCA
KRPLGSFSPTPFCPCSHNFIPLRIYAGHLILYNLLQGCFANRELRRQRRSASPRSFTKKVVITIYVYQEDPSYLRQCLTSIRNINYPKWRFSVVMIIDGNNPEDEYMMKIFEEVSCGEDLGTYVWKNNYHSCPTAGGKAEDPEKKEVERCTQHSKALQDKVCDSNTILNLHATRELVKVQRSDSNCGAVGGQVKINNPTSSCFSFMSSLSSWMDFNIESACQFYFNCVSCITGSLVASALGRPCWYHLTFLGIKSFFGDDQHLTNLGLRFIHLSCFCFPSQVCFTFRLSHPHAFSPLCWLAQWTRCSCSYIWEWILRVVWWPLYFVWIAYEVLLSLHLLVLVADPTLYLLYNGSILTWLWLLICLQLSGLLKAFSAAILRQRFTMILASLSSALDIAVLMPTQLFALITLCRSQARGRSGPERQGLGLRPPLLRQGTHLVTPRCPVWSAPGLAGPPPIIDRSREWVPGQGSSN